MKSAVCKNYLSVFLSHSPSPHANFSKVYGSQICFCSFRGSSASYLTWATVWKHRGQMESMVPSELYLCANFRFSCGITDVAPFGSAPRNWLQSFCQTSQRQISCISTVWCSVDNRPSYELIKFLRTTLRKLPENFASPEDQPQLAELKRILLLRIADIEFARAAVETSNAEEVEEEIPLPVLEDVPPDAPEPKHNE